jgi:regulator of sirC expression with transglutaminase-like and TPR domain
MSVNPPEGVDEEFQAFIRLPYERRDLTQGALLIAKLEYPQLAVQPYFNQLAQMEHEFKNRIQATPSVVHQMQILTRFLYEELGFHGNRDDYYDIKNSFLNDVLDRRMGIPITLGILVLIIGVKAGLPLFGINFPGHFMLLLKDGTNDLYFDPFDQGQPVSLLQLEQRLKSSNSQWTLKPSVHLQLMGPSWILYRVLSNLKKNYYEHNKKIQALHALNWMMQLRPGRIKDKREKGFLLFETNQIELAEAWIIRHKMLSQKPTLDAAMLQLWWKIQVKKNNYWN